MGVTEPPEPRRGDRFSVSGRREPLLVARVLLSVNEPDGSPWFVVESVHGNHWTLTASQEHNIRWLGEHHRAPADRKSRS